MIDSNELYNLKYSISEYLVPRLIAFKEIYEKGRSPTVPEIYSEEITSYLDCDSAKDLSFDELDKIWINILDDIIFSFNYQISEDKSTNSEETIKRVQKGLNLFAKYFTDLWI